MGQGIKQGVGIAIGIVLFALAAVTLFGIFNDNARAATTTVEITDSGFKPDAVSITTGQSVEFVNKRGDTVPFQVQDFIGNIKPGESHEHKFTMEGIFTATSIGTGKGGNFTIQMTVTVGKPAATSTPAAPTQTPKPAATATFTPVPKTIITQLPCKLDKIATWSEVDSAGPQRLEIGGASGGQHVDYYPNRNVDAVSYILPKGGSVRIWFGFGSDWQGDGPECESFNWVADATQYASGRMGNGHSGLVIDLRSGSPVIVANTANLSEKAVRDLLAIHRASQSGTVGEATLGSGISFGSSTGSSGGNQPGCPPAKEKDYKNPTDITVTGPVITHSWWNNGKPSFGQTLVRVMVPKGTTVTFIQMMGKTWTYEDNAACNANLQTEFDSNPNLPAKTINELRTEGLIRN